MMHVSQNQYTPLEEIHYVGLVRLVNLAEARGITVNLRGERDVYKAKASVRQLLLNDYAEKGRLTAEARHQREIQKYKDSNLPVPISLGQRVFEREEFMSAAGLDLSIDLDLIPENPCHPDPLAEYYRFHEK